MIRAAIVLAVMASPAGAAPPKWPLTDQGLGPVRIGMTQAQVAKALNSRLTGEAIDDENQCVEKSAKALPGVLFMFVDRRLSRVSIAKGSGITTRRGIGVGATAAAVRKAYGRGLKAEPNTYEDKPAEYLTYWTVPGRRGYRFETSTDRKVYVIHAGTNSIQYIEGCA
jgi:hypothetical protein